MDENKPHNKNVPPYGKIEPHARLLKCPSEEQMLYKIMRVEDLITSILGGYLHFNRVDCYNDFPGADIHDGQQLPKDQPENTITKFAVSPTFSVANYYNQSRTRTYACCFSIENSDYIWLNYGNGGIKGKVCLVFKFGKLRSTLNKTLQAENAALMYNGVRCHQLFSINYGIIEYVGWETHQANMERHPNPIVYTYLKDKECFESEKEFRISLSALGIGNFSLKDGNIIKFHSHLHVSFDFRAAIVDNTIQEIFLSPECDSDSLHSELHQLGIEEKNT